MKDMLVMRDGGVLRWGVIAAALVGGVLAQSAQAQCQYDVTIIQAPDCPWPFPPPGTVGTGINDLGQVVGYYSQCGGAEGNEAFLWTPESGVVTLDPPAGVWSARAWDVNEAGQIVGVMSASGVGDRGFLWEAGDWTELSPQGGGIHAGAYGNNALGQVTGYRDHDDGKAYARYAFIWEGGTFTDIPPTYGTKSVARDVNQAGQVVGWMGTSQFNDSHGFLWEDGEMIDLGVIPGGYTSEANAVNNSAQVVGKGRLSHPDPPGWVWHGFYWSNGEMIDLGTLPGYNRSTANDINDTPQIIGYCSYPDPNDARPFIWQHGQMTDLNELIPPESEVSLDSALAISNSGEITCWATDLGGHTVAAVLTPVGLPLGDVDADCDVDASDLALLLGTWGPCANCPADLNNDGIVNAGDLATLLGNWG